jgi:hypothetical protein
MKLFADRAVARAILHTMIQTLAQQSGGVFVFVYLLKAGVPTPLVLCVIAGMVASRFAMRPAVLPLARRIGLRASLIVGTVLEAAIFPLLPLVHGPGPLLLAVVEVGAAGSVVYWTCYHAYFASVGDAEHRGGQVGVREALSALVGIAAPAAGGWAMVTAGPTFAFDAAAVIQLAAVAPLIGAPDVAVAHDAPGGFRAALMGGALMATDGWFASAFYYMWQIALFISLGEGFAGYGGAMALAGLAGAAGGLAAGRLVDRGHGRRSVLLVYGWCAIVVTVRAASYGNPALAVATNALGATAAPMLVPVLMTRVYNLAQASPCPLRFHIATEGGWDIGCGTGCLAAAGLLALGASPGLATLLALAGAAAASALLFRIYGASR